MTHNSNKPILNQVIIHQLRAIARTTPSPSDIFFYLAPKVPDMYLFTDYLLVAFSDESIMWTIATRWWHGDYPNRNADNALRFSLNQTTRYWW